MGMSAGTPGAVPGRLLAPGSGQGSRPQAPSHEDAGPPCLSKRRCSVFFTHFKRQQVRKAMDMSRMMAQLTMEAITATLKPKVSWGVTAAREMRPAPGMARPGPAVALTLPPGAHAIGRQAAGR